MNGGKKEYNHLQAYWRSQLFSVVRKQLCILWLRRWGNGSKKNMDKMSSQWSSFFPQAWTLPKFSITFQLSGVLSITSPRTRISGGLTIWVGSGERLLIFLGMTAVLWPQKENSILSKIPKREIPSNLFIELSLFFQKKRFFNKDNFPKY